MRNVTKEMAYVQKQMQVLNETLRENAAKTGKSTENNAKALESMRTYRSAIDDFVTGQGHMFARQMQITSATEKFSKRIAEQRVTFGELIRQRKLMNSVLKEQIALQNASASSWSRASGGKMNVTLYQPLEIAKGLATSRQQIGLWNAALASGSDQLIKWGKNTQWAGRQLMVGFTVPMAAAAIATGKMAWDIDKALTKIVKVYGDANAAFQESSDSIKSAAMETARASAAIYGQTISDTLAIQGELAAAGKSGLELQAATLQTNRIAVLGELDWQDAVKASITMSEVYGYKANALGDAFAYVNAMENQTVLTSQDFVTAIPKVAGIMNALGADIKQTGTLLTGFKAAGIDAAEGANALKSINFRAVATYGKGLETFKAMTGQDLKQIVAETKGETIPTLERFAQAISNLSAPDKVAVTRDVFGIYQGSKAMLLLEQMMNKSEQYTRAMEVANNSAAENAAIMQRELDKLSEAPYMRIKKAVEGLKAELYSVGETILKAAAPLVEFTQRFVEWFNSLDDGLKKFMLIGAGLTAIAGPAVMLLGLFANLVGQVAKFATNVGNLFLRFKVTNAEERAQLILAKQMNDVWDSQTATLAKLTSVVRDLSNAYLTTAKNSKMLADAQYDLENPRWGSREHSLANLPPGFTSFQNKQGKTQYRENGRFVNENAVMYAGYERMWNEAHRLNVEFDDWRGAEAMQKQEFETRRAAKSMEAFIGKVGMATAGVSVLSNLVTNGMAPAWLHVVESSAMALGMISAAWPKGVAKLIMMLKPHILALGSLIKSVGIASIAMVPKSIRMGSLDAVKTKLASMLPMLKGIGLGFGAVAIAAGFAWKKINDNIEANRKRMDDYGNSVERVADLLGFAYQQAAKLEDSGPEGQQASVNELTAKWLETEEGKNTAAVMKDNVKKGAKNLADEVENMWNEAITMGLKARLHGATVDQAQTAVRMALKAVGMKDLSDEDFMYGLLERGVNFNIDQSVLDNQAKQLVRQFNLALEENSSGGESFTRFFIGEGELTQAGATQIRDLAQESWNMFYAADADAREELFSRQATEINKDLMALYEEAMRADPARMKAWGVTNYSEFLNWMSTSNSSGFLTGMLGKTREQIETFQRGSQAARDFLGVFMDTGNVAKIASNDWRDYLPVLEGRGLFSGAIDSTKALDAALSDAERSATDLERALKDGNFNEAITPDVAEESWKNVITGTLDDVVDLANDQMEEHWDNYVNNIEKAGDKAVDAAEESAEKQKRAFDEAWEVTMENFEKREEARREAIENSYDARIKKIEDTIKAEEDAEEKRKRIFDAERARIQRLAEMLNDSIDINAAINSGNLDEAAKLQNTSMAKQLDWVAQDSEITQGDAYKERIDQLNSVKDGIEAEKKAAIDSFEEVSAAREKALEKQQEAAKEALDKRLEMMKDEVKASADADNEKARKTAETKKASLERELALIRAYVPRNEAEMNEQIAAIDALYSKYGVRLSDQGKEWSKAVAGSLSYQVDYEANRLKTLVNWKSIGSSIAAGILDGAFGMTPAQFAAWINGGEAPITSLFGTNPDRVDSSRWGKGFIEGNGGGTGGPEEAHHVGGIAGMGGARIGKSGDKKPSEIDVRLLRGEGIVNRIAMKTLGQTGLDAINEGRAMGGGTGPMGMAGLVGAMQSAAVKEVIGQTFKAAAMKRMGMPTKFGAEMPVSPPDSPTIMSTIGSAIGSILGAGSFKGAVRPTSGTVTSEYGPRRLFGMTFHNGIDIANRTGTPIYAVQSGKVIHAGWDNTGYGNYVKIAHGDGLTTGYGHNSSILVRAGQAVSKGQMIARMGSTGKSSGPHSHFQTGRNGSWYNPRLSFPNLNVGGMVLRDGLANIHEEEAVLTKPLTKDFERGVRNFADGGNVEYNVSVVVQGSVNSDVDIERAVITALQKAEKKRGADRKIGR